MSALTLGCENNKCVIMPGVGVAARYYTNCIIACCYTKGKPAILCSSLQAPALAAAVADAAAVQGNEGKAMQYLVAHAMELKKSAGCRTL